MPTYAVPVTCPVTMSGIVQVEAGSFEAAKERADADLKAGILNPGLHVNWNYSALHTALTYIGWKRALGLVSTKGDW